MPTDLFNTVLFHCRVKPNICQLVFVLSNRLNVDFLLLSSDQELLVVFRTPQRTGGVQHHQDFRPPSELTPASPRRRRWLALPSLRPSAAITATGDVLLGGGATRSGSGCCCFCVQIHEKHKQRVGCFGWQRQAQVGNYAFCANILTLIGAGAEDCGSLADVNEQSAAKC